MGELDRMRSAIEHLEAALKELQERVATQEVTPEIAVELSEKLRSAHNRISELEKRFEGQRDA